MHFPPILYKCFSEPEVNSYIISSVLLILYKSFQMRMLKTYINLTVSLILYKFSCFKCAMSEASGPVIGAMVASGDEWTYIILKESLILYKKMAILISGTYIKLKVSLILYKNRRPNTKTTPDIQKSLWRINNQRDSLFNKSINY